MSEATNVSNHNTKEIEMSNDSPRTEDTPTPRCPDCGGPDISGGPCQANKS